MSAPAMALVYPAPGTRHPSQSSTTTSTSSASSSETAPLLPRRDASFASSLDPKQAARPWYRGPRTMWLIPFALTASLSRGMTLAPRIAIYTHLACKSLQRVHFQLPSPAHSFDSLDATVLASKCLSDPAVQATASKLQTLMIVIVGVLSALTTSWWTTFSDKHGRTKVMAMALIGVLFTDVMFIVATNYSRYIIGGHHILVLGPLLEGLLGSYPVMQAAINAYISDSTNEGSRSKVFGRFTGVSCIGLAIGPSIGSIILSRIPRSSSDHAYIFYISVTCALANLLYVLLVLPESLTADARDALAVARQQVKDNRRAKDERREAEEAADGSAPAYGWAKHVRRLKRRVLKPLQPLKVFRPQARINRRGKDYNLFILAIAYFFYLLTSGLSPVKYLYAGHVFSWGANELGHYITLVSTIRAVFLLFLLPMIIKAFKPAPPSTPFKPNYTSGNPAPDTPAARRARLAQNIKFDLRVARVSFVIELASYIAATASNSPLGFVISTSLTSFGGGAGPAAQSLALCLLPNPKEDSGKLFGAISMMQAISSGVLGPIAFGLVYSMTVAHFSKTIYVFTAGILFASLVLLSLMHPTAKVKRDLEVQRRGRSRVSKDLRGVIPTRMAPGAPPASRP
ncbi:hypothetical protein BOTBODRAFT_31419 [Botryobasidium botryosum FD-172 SS1]|uniref:Major facilitator superfamily (MFS) profile domain-containing protein n=1 Tax=Botryobasidium botryosum (strain FD-172 SS1) TaxID=930990 RepID=A0A067MMM1_BOTB1|nr:hypothetical protein BOTBODRAFT_31419 [Botryobasidium botryosum FD-172 SS1]